MLDLPAPDQNPHPVSVVIPTLGGESLRRTIEQLNRGTLAPAEILICIPEEDAFRVENFSIHNVAVIKTSMRGQVAQRATGFGHVRHRMVLQLDDDILLHEKALEELTEALHRLGRGYALAPVYYAAETGRCLHELSVGLKGFFKNVYACVVCGASWGKKRMGSLTSIGIGYGVDTRHCSDKAIQTEWLPGGCVLSYREDLIQENFYPFAGKAYSEDVIHSLLRRKRGITHAVILRATCRTGSQPFTLDVRSIKADMRARMYVVQLGSGKVWRLLAWFAFDHFKRVLLHVLEVALRKIMR